ncbi:MAG: MFS transporter [Candidatus Bathyarchaeia archaeon]
MNSGSAYSFLRERNIVVLIACRIIWGLTQALFTSYFSLFALAQKGVTPELLGLIVSVKSLGTVILSPIAGYLADALGRKKMIFAGTCLHAASYLFYLVATDFNMIFIGSLVEGMAVLHMPALQAITQDSLVRSRRSLGLSATTGLQAIPTLISPFIGGLLAERLGIDAGMRIGFGLAFAAGILVAFIRLKFLRETVNDVTERFDVMGIYKVVKRSYAGMFSLLREYKLLRGFIYVSLVDTFFASITAPFWVVYAKTIIGLTTVEWGIIEVIAAAVNILVLFFSGSLVDRLGKKKIMLLNLTAAPVVNLAFIYCGNATHVALIRVLLTAQNAFILPAATALLADIVPRKDRGRAIAAVGWQPIVISIGAVSSGFFRFLPYFIGSLLSGYVYELDVRLPWYLLVSGYVAEAVICHYVVREPENPAE